MAYTVVRKLAFVRGEALRPHCQAALLSVVSGKHELTFIVRTRCGYARDSINNCNSRARDGRTFSVNYNTRNRLRRGIRKCKRADDSK